MSSDTTLLIGTIMSTGMMAGLLVGWAVSVIPGTARVDDRTYVATMQSINVAIINPAFVIPFLGTPLLLAAAGIAQYRVGEHRRSMLLLSAAGTYVVGVLGVTGTRNVPLNNALADHDLASAADRATGTQRARYERPWNRWHVVRTAAAVATFALATTATLTDGAAG